MANPVWITESFIGTFNVGETIFLNVVAMPVNPAVQITYNQIYGTLPAGVSFDAISGFLTGTITGTTSQTYAFTIQAVDEFGNSSNQTFQIRVVFVPVQPSWITPTGSLGTIPAGIPMTPVVLQATPISPASSLTYSLLSGSIPNGLILSTNGIISGTPSSLYEDEEFQFTVRVTDNNDNIADRTFVIATSGTNAPQFTGANGNILSTFDSVWVELQIGYLNPNPDNEIRIRVTEGSLPPGLEINETGLIRGYPAPPTITVNLPIVVTTATLTENTNIITCLSTIGFIEGRPVIFTGVSVFGNIIANKIYYIKTIVSPTEFTISETQFGSTYILSSGTGVMTVTLQVMSVGQPTERTFTFALTLESLLGSASSTYSITITNQTYNNLNLPNTRKPVILNTRPETYVIPQSDPYYGYYIVPTSTSGATYPVTTPAPMGNYLSDNFFAFKVIGKDFDDNPISYQFNSLPYWLTGNTNTGWITGNPSLLANDITEFNFSVSVYKTSAPSISSTPISFSVSLSKNITPTITWITTSDLGYIYNGQVSIKSVVAIADVELQYRLISGSLPPNLTLSDNGDIIGFVSDQPTENLLQENEQTVFNFVIEAYSPQYSVLKSQKTFSITIIQEFAEPSDTLYIKAMPSIEDRVYINSLLTDVAIIPENYLFRPSDQNFGKATDVIYEHAFGINASNLQEYLAAVTQNHYWRQIVLGELSIAMARDENNTVLYEVVYSNVIDNLINPEGISINSPIIWPRDIDLGLGPWYTSSTNIYTSYVTVLSQNYYTSLSPGYAQVLYPNSLVNMRNRVASVVGQDSNSKILPSWMTSQQENGSTLGYTPAWVICYVKPYIVVNGSPITYEEFEAQGLDRSKYQSYAEIIKNNIETNWKNEHGEVNKLNKINFQIDRFSVDKSLTYDYNNNTTPPSWIGLPSSTPTPNPIDSKDFYVYFPRKTILPDETQY